jgi:hypothetical protein
MGNLKAVSLTPLEALQKFYTKYALVAISIEIKSKIIYSTLATRPGFARVQC